MEKLEKLKHPTATLEAMRLKATVNAPNTQRESINRLIARLRDRGTKRFTCNRVNDDYFAIKRIQ